MTTVIAVERKDRLIFGSDTQATEGNHKHSVDGGKFIQTAGYTFGLAGIWEMFAKLKNAELPQLEGDDVDAHMHRVFAPFVSNLQDELFDDFGIDKDSPFAPGSHLLVGYAGRLYDLRIGGTPIRTVDGVYSIGSGSRYAFGALAGSRRKDEKAVKHALESAARYDAYTSGPFYVETFWNE